MRRYVVNPSDQAKKIRETFTDKPAKKRTSVLWEWPESLQEVGYCHAIMYTSDKWKRDGDYEHYKHVIEDPPWYLYVEKGFIRDHANHRPVPVSGPMVRMNRPLPTEIAELALIMGIQCELYQGRRHQPNKQGELFQIDIARAKLGGAVHPKTGEQFLMVYSRSDLCCVITGASLTIERDGLMG